MIKPIQFYNKDTYGICYGNENNYRPCSCCGLEVTTDLAETTVPKLGIKVVPKLIGTPGDKDTVEVTHLQTRNGPITISIRHSWNNKEAVKNEKHGDPDIYF